jgi:hypothetical protein
MHMSKRKENEPNLAKAFTCRPKRWNIPSKLAIYQFASAVVMPFHDEWPIRYNLKEIPSKFTNVHNLSLPDK